MARRRHGRAHKDEREPGAWRAVYARWGGVGISGGISYRNAQLKLWGIGTSQLVMRQEAGGYWVNKKEANILNKLSTRKFIADFMLQCLIDIGAS